MLIGILPADKTVEASSEIRHHGSGVTELTFTATSHSKKLAGLTDLINQAIINHGTANLLEQLVQSLDFVYINCKHMIFAAECKATNMKQASERKD